MAAISKWGEERERRDQCQAELPELLSWRYMPAKNKKNKQTTVPHKNVLQSLIPPSQGFIQGDGGPPLPSLLNQHKYFNNVVLKQNCCSKEVYFILAVKHW